jgi:monoamine oxidase
LAEGALCQVHDSHESVAERLGSVRLSGATRALAHEWFTQVWGATAETLSIRAIGLVRNAWASGDGAWRVVEGFDRVAAFLAEGLDVRLAGAVRTIGWRPGRVEARTDSFTVTARTLVLTVPPSVLTGRGIEFVPPLPRAKYVAAARLRLGGSVVAVYRLRSPAPASMWALMVDRCGGFWRTYARSPFLVGWIKGPRAYHAAAMLRTGDLADHVGAAMFPGAELGPAETVQVVDWGADEFSRGGFSYPTTAGLAAAERWADPVSSTLFFAGEASCGARHLATVQGALESGTRAAAEVAEALGA